MAQHHPSVCFFDPAVVGWCWIILSTFLTSIVLSKKQATYIVFHVRLQIWLEGKRLDRHNKHTTITHPCFFILLDIISTIHRVCTTLIQVIIITWICQTQLTYWTHTCRFNPLSPNNVSNVNFLLTISIQCQEIRLWELIKWSPKGKCLDLLSNSLNLFLKEMYRYQFGEFVRGYWGYEN